MPTLRTALLASALPVLSLGCATAEQHQALEQKVADLEKRIETLESRPAAAGKQAPAVDPKLEEEAQAIYKSMTEFIDVNDFEQAKAKGDELKAKYSATTTYKRAMKSMSELEVIGRPVTAEWSSNVETWFQGEGSVDLTKGTTLVVFWEVWCPHCRNHMPELVKTYDNWHGKGLNVAAFTRITKSATEEKVKEFMGENKMQYPVAKENGKLATLFGVGGIPAAAVVKDGKIIWRGHPARLNDDAIAKFLGS